MKLLTLTLAVALTGCSSMADPTIFLDAAGNVVTGLTQESTNKQGYTSRDAAYIKNYSTYSKNKADQKERKYVEIKAAPGKSIENLESITVYAPPAPGETHIAAPVQPDSNLVAGIKAGTDGAAKVLGAILPFEVVNRTADTLNKQIDANTEAERLRAATVQAAIAKEPAPPVIITVPE